MAERAGKMAERTNLRPIGVIENMSWFVCPHCGEPTSIFGQGGGNEAAETLGVPLFAQVPLEPALREGGDDGAPIVVTDPDSPAGEALRRAARGARAHDAIEGRQAAAAHGSTRRSRDGRRPSWPRPLRRGQGAVRSASAGVPGRRAIVVVG